MREITYNIIFKSYAKFGAYPVFFIQFLFSSKLALVLNFSKALTEPAFTLLKHFNFHKAPATKTRILKLSFIQFVNTSQSYNLL